MMIKKIKLPGVIYEMTTVCNLNCKYCYNYWKKESDDTSDIQKFSPKKTLKQFMKSVKCDSISFSGGEPTTNFLELLDCIMYFKARNKTVTIISNATLLDSEKIDILAKLKVDLMEITINSYDKTIHENINGMKGSFDKSIASIKELMQKGIEVVVPIVITKYNVKDIDKTLEFIYNLGIRRIMLNRYNIGGNGCNKHDDVLADYQDLKSAFQKSQEFAENHNLELYSFVCTPHCVLNPDDYPNIVFTNCGINNLNRRYTLTRDGNIRFCNHSPEILGNIYENTMENILKSDKLKQWAEIEPDFCKTCTKKHDCQYGCRAASQQMGYGLKSEDPLVSIYNIPESFKNENEVTVRVICSKDELLNYLKKQGFKAGREFSLNDYYYIPSSLNIENMSTREILSKAIILRYIIDNGEIIQKITYKIKNIAENGDIISQRAINCNVQNIEDAKKIFEALDYYEIMNIKEDDVIYYKNKFELAIKFIENSDILMEIETKPNTEWSTIENIKTIISKMNMPIEKDNYFIKKAEDELNKILKR